MELLLLFWIVCGVIAAVLAQSKDRSPLTGGLFGLILGPLGVLIVAFQSKLKPGETERAQTSIGKPVRYLMIGTGVLIALLVILALTTAAANAASTTSASAGRWQPGTSYFISEDDATSYLEKAFDHVYCDGVPRFGHRGDEFRRFDCDIFDSRFDCTVRIRAVKGSRPGYFRLKMGWAASTCY